MRSSSSNGSSRRWPSWATARRSSVPTDKRGIRCASPLASPRAVVPGPHREDHPFRASSRVTPIRSTIVSRSAGASCTCASRRRRSARSTVSPRTSNRSSRSALRTKDNREVEDTTTRARAESALRSLVQRRRRGALHSRSRRRHHEDVTRPRGVRPRRPERFSSIPSRCASCAASVPPAHDALRPVAELLPGRPALLVLHGNEKALIDHILVSERLFGFCEGLRDLQRGAPLSRAARRADRGDRGQRPRALRGDVSSSQLDRAGMRRPRSAQVQCASARRLFHALFVADRAECEAALRGMTIAVLGAVAASATHEKDRTPMKSLFSKLMLVAVLAAPFAGVAACSSDDGTDTSNGQTISDLDIGGDVTLDKARAADVGDGEVRRRHHHRERDLERRPRLEHRRLPASPPSRRTAW